MDDHDLARGAQRRLEKERKRAVRACDNCRRQKEKCDGGVPCRRCQRLHRPCKFLGLPIGEGTSLELVASQQRIFELEERLKHMERLLTHYTGNIKTDLNSLRLMTQTLDDQSEPQPQPLDTRSEDSSSLEVDQENFTFQPLGDNITHYSGEFSHWNFSMRIKQWIENCVLDQNRADHADATKFEEYYRAEELQSQSALGSLSSLPPRFVADFLMNSFFKHAETNYFYVERTWLTRKLDVVYTNPESLSRRDVGTVCMIWIIMAIGTQFAYLDSQSPGAPSRFTGKGSFSEDTVGVMFYQQACRLVPDIITIASMESVQACLLIGIYTLPLDASGLSYIYLNLALKLAIQNGMHRKVPEGELDPVTRETSNRVWWSVYTTEKRIGIYHGRPVSISDTDIDVEMPKDRPELMSFIDATQYPRMMATLELNQGLMHIAKEISRLNTYSKHEISEKLSKVVDLKNKLEKWWRELPNDVFQKEIDTQSLVSRPDAHLKLEYCLVRMFAGRPFLFPRGTVRGLGSTGRSSESPSDASSRPTAANKTNARSILVGDCVEAALCVIDTCKVLQKTIGLARASYTEFSACRAALLVIIAQCLQKKTNRLHDALGQGILMIKEMAAGGKSATSEASLIEAFERAIARLDILDNEPPNVPEQPNYSNFKRWEMLWKSTTGGQESEDGVFSEIAPMMPMTHLAQPASGSAQEGVGVPLTPFFGVDANFQAFAQPDEMSSFFGYDSGLNLDDMSGAGDNGSTWMSR